MATAYYYREKIKSACKNVILNIGESREKLIQKRADDIIRKYELKRSNKLYGFLVCIPSKEEAIHMLKKDFSYMGDDSFSTYYLIKRSYWEHDEEAAKRLLNLCETTKDEKILLTDVNVSLFVKWNLKDIIS